MEMTVEKADGLRDAAVRNAGYVRTAGAPEDQISDAEALVKLTEELWHELYVTPLRLRAEPA